MSMTFLILNGFQLNPDYYGCPKDRASQPPGVQRPYWGVYFLLSGIFILMLYIPCLVAIATSQHMKSPAFKAMLVLGLYDISSVFVNSVATGILGLFGIAFCDFPRLNLFLGSIGLGSWMGCCISSMTLAVIRICDMSSNLKLRKWFDGRRINVCLFVFWAYGFGAALLSKPVVFTPVYMSWFFDPGVGKDPAIYVNLAHTFNNILMTVFTILFYGYLSFLVIQESSASSTNRFSNYQSSILLQTFFFCIFHAIGSCLYAYMQFVSAPDFLILVGQIAWQSSSGSVCVVYLTLNQTIRKSVIRLISPKRFASGAQVTVVMPFDSRTQGM